MNKFESVISGYRQAEIQHNDTLQRMALRELGDAAKWMEIANLNGLVDPYITGDELVASDRVALYGDLIWVPAATPMVSSLTSPELTFDQDVSLINGALTSDGSDFNLSYGIDNLKQALSHRIGTDKKDLLFHPQYGCDVRRLIGGLNSPVAEILAASYIERALRGDPRVKDVPSCLATVSGDSIFVEAEVIPIDGRRLQFGGYF
jgi:phage baseplate assembly protein W